MDTSKHIGTAEVPIYARFNDQDTHVGTVSVDIRMADQDAEGVIEDIRQAFNDVGRMNTNDVAYATYEEVARDDVTHPQPPDLTITTAAPMVVMVHGSGTVTMWSDDDDFTASLDYLRPIEKATAIARLRTILDHLTTYDVLRLREDNR